MSIISYYKWKLKRRLYLWLWSRAKKLGKMGTLYLNARYPWGRKVLTAIEMRFFYVTESNFFLKRQRYIESFEEDE